MKDLKQRFLKYQAKFHPDLFMNHPKDERLESELISMELNKAYQTLKDPLKRAKHLLKLEGLEIPENMEINDPEFLFRVMEIQEEVIEADERGLEDLMKENDNRFAKTVLDIKNAFQTKDYQLAQQNIVKLNYWTTIRKLINDRLE